MSDMMARRSMFQLFTGGIVAMFASAGCSSGRRAEYRFRLTVEVETPDGLRRGSSVYQVAAWNKLALAPGGKARTWMIVGEAVAVELPGTRTLFALLRTSAIHHDMAGLSMATFDPAFRNDVVECAERIVNGDGIRSPAVVSPAHYPVLVTFDDAADPATVKEMPASELDTAFGPGFRLAGIEAELTDDSVTAGLKRRLPWLTEGSPYVSTGPRLVKNVDPYDHSLTSSLTVGDFLSRGR